MRSNNKLCCLQALIYKGTMKRGSLEIADDILEKIYKQVAVPFFTGYISLMAPIGMLNLEII